jgi:hypothetical protein
MNGICEEVTLFVKEAEVNAPGVNTDGSDIAVVAVRAFTDRGFDFVKDADDVPCELTRYHNGFIREAVVFFEGDFFTVERADDTAAAGSAKVNGKHFDFFHDLMYFLSISFFYVLNTVSQEGLRSSPSKFA